MPQRLRDHVIAVHFCCLKCDITFNSKPETLSHFKEAHPETSIYQFEKKAECKLCTYIGRDNKNNPDEDKTKGSHRATLSEAQSIFYNHIREVIFSDHEIVTLQSLVGEYMRVLSNQRTETFLRN